MGAFANTMITSRGALGHRVQVTLGIWLSLWLVAVRSAFVEFTNCLDPSVQESNPRLLQFVPLNVSAVFNTNGSSHVLNVTFYGNVTGQLYNGPYPSPDDPSWTNPNNSFGKIVDVQDGQDIATTLFASFNVLNYVPYDFPAARFCENTVNEGCPVGPAFYKNSSDVLDLPGYTIAHELSSYSFSTIQATTRIQAGTSDGRYYGCVNAYITPDLGNSLRGLLTYLPMAILAVVGIATICAATLSPWSSMNVFHWSSNYGRDEDVLRLVTPGFGDCLQYLQFIVLTGSLNLNYPGFYQPVVSRIGWSSLLFNESMVTGGNGTRAVVDGIYQYRANSKQGLDRTTQLIGMTSPSDAWADMMVWLVVIMVCAIIITQIGFLLQWIYRQVKDVTPEDLRSMNWYFSVGNIVRTALGYFLLPLVTLSMYQFVIASLGPVYAVALAALVLAFVVAFAAWLTFRFVRIRPRSFLFDDLQTVLLYGPLYNTYRDDTATFALVPILLTFVRGIAIGAVQASGVAQIILLAISEVVLILTLNAIRPYAAATSMNLYQTCFSVVRLLTLMLAIAFIPSLAVSSASRGWIAYVILLTHACVLVFGFFINALQTLIEVIARLAGAGATGNRDAARGGLVKVFGMRQLSRRIPRRDVAQRTSMGRNAQMLAVQDAKDELNMARTRSMSASSNLLLDGNKRKHTSQADGSSRGLQTPDGMSTRSRQSKNLSSPGGIVGLAKTESRDPYYRPPRRSTNDFINRPHLLPSDQKNAPEHAIDDGGEGSSQNRAERDEFDDAGTEPTKTKTDYAVREVDFYYGIRGGPLSGSTGTRKMRTGPADPTGPVSSARGWFKGLLGRKTKKNGKSFEVVRSAKAPPGFFPPTLEVENEESTPYHDEPETSAKKSIDVKNQSFSEADERAGSPIPRAPTRPPMLPAFDAMSGIELPSRIGSEASRRRAPPPVEAAPPVPPVPRRSSRRTSSPASIPDDFRVPLTAAAPSENVIRGNRDTQYSASATSQRLPFARTGSNRQTNRDSAAISEMSSNMDETVLDEEPEPPPGQNVHRPGSVGFVNQHRASDNIRHSPHEAQIPHLSAVEYGYQPQPYNQTQGGQITPSWNGSSAYNADGSQRVSRFRD